VLVSIIVYLIDHLYSKKDAQVTIKYDEGQTFVIGLINILQRVINFEEYFANSQ
jgi:hypothetical protein